MIKFRGSPDFHASPLSYVGRRGGEREGETTYSAVPDERKEIGMRQPVTLRAVISLLGIATLVLVAGSFAIADITPPAPPPPGSQCDFLTGGGFIFATASQGTFAIGGGCRHGSGIDGAPYWGHLEYHDHGLYLNVHWNDITASFPDGPTGTDTHTGQSTGVRWVCGTARTDKF